MLSVLSNLMFVSTIYHYDNLNLLLVRMPSNLVFSLFTNSGGLVNGLYACIIFIIINYMAHLRDIIDVTAVCFHRPMRRAPYIAYKFHIYRRTQVFQLKL